MKRRLLVQTPLRRRLSALAAGATLVAATAGCQVFNPVQTDVPYVPADGVPADIGTLAVRDLVLVGEGTGTAVLSGSAVNSGNDQLSVKFQTQAAQGATQPATGSEVQLAPGEQVDLSRKGLQLSGITAKPGTLVPMLITSSTGGSTVVSVPVLPPTQYYSTVTPTPTGTGAA